MTAHFAAALMPFFYKKARVVSDLTQHKDYFKQDWLKLVTRLLDYLSMNIFF